MSKKTSLPLTIILVSLVLFALILTPQTLSSMRPLRLGAVRPGYFHFWHFSGVTNDEFVEGPAYTIDETNFPITSNIEEIVEEMKYSVIAHVTKELVDQFAAKGYAVTVNSVYPTARIEQRTERQQFRDYTKITIYSKLVIDCDVEFETDKPVADSPFPAWALAILLIVMDKLPALILATIVGVGIYVAVNTWVNSFAISESIVEVEYYEETVIEEYDEEGNLVERTTTTLTTRDYTVQKGSSWQGLLTTVVWLLIVGIILVVGVPFVLRRRKGGG